MANKLVALPGQGVHAAEGVLPIPIREFVQCVLQQPADTFNVDLAQISRVGQLDATAYKQGRLSLSDIG